MNGSLSKECKKWLRAMAQIESKGGSFSNEDISEYLDAISFLSKELDDSTQAAIKLLERPWNLVLSSYFENAELQNPNTQDCFEKITALRVYMPRVDRDYYFAIFAKMMPEGLWAADLSARKMWRLCYYCGEMPKFIIWLSVSKRFSLLVIEENSAEAILVKYLVDLVKNTADQSHNIHLQLCRMLGKSSTEMIAAVGIFLYRSCLDKSVDEVHFIAILTLLLNRHDPSLLPPLILWINLFLLLCTRQSLEKLQNINIKLWISICELLNSRSVKAGSSPGDLARLLKLQDLTMSDLYKVNIASQIAYVDRPIAEATNILESHQTLSGFLARNAQSGRFTLGKQLLGTDAYNVPSPRPSSSRANDNHPNKFKYTESASDIAAQIQALKSRKFELENAVTKPTSSDSFIGGKVFFLDTNVLLDHFCTIRDLFYVSEIQFILPLTVINEVDGLCHSENEMRRKMAQGARDVISNPSAPIQAISASGIFLEAIEPVRLDHPKVSTIKSNDDAIMHSVMSYSANNGHKTAILVSDDVNLALKCAAHGVNAMSWKSFMDAIQNIY